MVKPITNKDKDKEGLHASSFYSPNGDTVSTLSRDDSSDSVLSSSSSSSSIFDNASYMMHQAMTCGDRIKWWSYRGFILMAIILGVVVLIGSFIVKPVLMKYRKNQIIKNTENLRQTQKT